MCLLLKWGALEWIYHTHCNYVHRCGIFQLSSEHMIPWSHPFYSYKGDLRWANRHLSLKETTQWKSNVKMSGNLCLEFPKWTRRKQWTDHSSLIVQVSAWLYGNVCSRFYIGFCGKIRGQGHEGRMNVFLHNWESKICSCKSRSSDFFNDLVACLFIPP